MATLHSDLPRSPATGKARALAVTARRPMLSGGSVLRFAMVLAVLLALFLVGQAASRATESLAIGIIAADLAFLVAIAAWSSVAAAKRR